MRFKPSVLSLNVGKIRSHQNKKTCVKVWAESQISRNQVPRKSQQNEHKSQVCLVLTIIWGNNVGCATNAPMATILCSHLFSWWISQFRNRKVSDLSDIIDAWWLLMISFLIHRTNTSNSFFFCFFYKAWLCNNAAVWWTVTELGHEGTLTLIKLDNLIICCTN